MSVVLVEARHFGYVLRYVRTKNSMIRAEFAHLLKIQKTELRQYERGSKIISDAILMRLLMYGVTLLKARYTRFNPDDFK